MKSFLNAYIFDGGVLLLAARLFFYPRGFWIVFGILAAVGLLAWGFWLTDFGRAVLSEVDRQSGE